VNYFEKIRVSKIVRRGLTHTNKFEKSLLNDLEMIFGADTTKDEDFNPKVERLIYRSHAFNKSILIKIRIVFIIAKTRGLTRALFGIYPVLNKFEADEIRKIAKWNLIFIILINYRKVNALILSKLALKEMDFEEIKEIQKIDQVAYYRPENLKDYNKYSELVFETSINLDRNFNISSTYSNHPSLKTILSLIKWNAVYFVQLIRIFGLEESSKPFLTKWFPDLHEEIDLYIKVSLEHHPRSSSPLDFYFDNPSFETFSSVNSAEIWHQRFILTENTLNVIDSTSSPDLGFVAGQHQYIKTVSAQSSQYLIRRCKSDQLFLDSGIFLIGRCDENWYHFLLDTLPRIIYFENLPKNIPILIRKDIPETSKMLIRMISDREIVELESDSLVTVKKLYFCPARSTAFDSKPSSNEDLVHFSPKSYQVLRKTLLLSFENRVSHDKDHRLLLIREGTARNVVNMNSLRGIFIEFNFGLKRIDSEFFNNQVNVFNGADFIVTAGGAALANMLFMKPDSKVMVLQSYRNRKILIWEKLAAACKVEIIPVYGFPLYHGRNWAMRLHSSFYISQRKVRKILSSEITPKI
jgi:capsular polysaccharide biosynthesis protein